MKFSTAPYQPLPLYKGHKIPEARVGHWTPSRRFVIFKGTLGWYVTHAPSGVQFVPHPKNAGLVSAKLFAERLENVQTPTFDALHTEYVYEAKTRLRAECAADFEALKTAAQFPEQSHG